MSGFEWYVMGVLLMLGLAFLAGTQLPSRGAVTTGGIAAGIAFMLILKLHSLSEYL